MTKATCLLTSTVLATGLFLASLAMAETVLTQVSGDVQIGRGEPTEWITAQNGDVAEANDRVRTGADGRVEIKLDSGTLRVHENSMLRLAPPVNDADQVELEEGRSLFDVLRRKGRRFEVHTPTVVVSVKGTRFGVDAGTDVGEVTVYHGTVGVRELGADDVMETLVREGFLATGGVGIPVEIDVSTTPDPWNQWQEFDRGQLEERVRPKRMGEVDRAKAALHRATAADVIVKAAERKPEVARRLKEIQDKQREAAERDNGESDDPEDPKRERPDSGLMAPMPAAPDLGNESPSSIKQKILQERLGDESRALRMEEIRRQTLEAKEMIDATRIDQEMMADDLIDVDKLSGSGSFTGSNTTLDYAALYEMSPTALVVVRDALLDLETEYQAGTFVPTASSDLTGELERALMDEGFTLSEATQAVQTLLGN